MTTAVFAVVKNVQGGFQVRLSMNLGMTLGAMPPVFISILPLARENDISACRTLGALSIMVRNAQPTEIKSLAIMQELTPDVDLCRF